MECTDAHDVLLHGQQQACNTTAVNGILSPRTTDAVTKEWNVWPVGVVATSIAPFPLGAVFSGAVEVIAARTHTVLLMPTPLR